MGGITRFNKLVEQADEGMRSEASQIYLMLQDQKFTEEQKRELKLRLDKILNDLAEELKAAGKKEKDRVERPPF